MLVHSLVGLYDILLTAGKVPPVGRSNLTSLYTMADISAEGELLGLSEPVRTETGVLNPVPMQGGHTNSGDDPFFLCDNFKFIFNIGTKGGTQFKASSKLHKHLLQKVKSKPLQAVYKFFNRNPVGARHPVIKQYLKDYKDADKVWVLFYHKGKPALNKEAWDIWDKEYSARQTALPLLDTIDSGMAPVIETHPKIKGRGCGGLGAALISNNADCSKSFDIEGGYNAPVSSIGAFKYTTALTYVLSSKQAAPLGDCVVAFWAGAVELSVLAGALDFKTISKEGAVELAGAVQDIRRGKLPDSYASLRNTPFTCCVFKPNSSRLALKYLWTAELDTVIQNIGAWWSGVETSPYILGSLLTGTGTFDALPDPYKLALYRHIMFATPLQEYFLYLAVNRYKLSMLKSAYKKPIGKFVTYYIKERRTPMTTPFKVGQLFALLESIQYAANKQDSIQKLFKAACETPGAQIPRLRKAAQSIYLPQIEGGLRYWYQKQLSELSSEIGELAPAKRYTLAEQAEFISGYDSEVCKRFKKSTANAEEK